MGSWATSPQLCEPQNSIPTAEISHVVLRQLVHLTLGGSSYRVQLSNEFGTQPLDVASAHVARPLSGAPGVIDSKTDHALTFAGQPAVSIPGGASYLSDPIPFAIAPQSDLAITLAIDQIPPHQTCHPGSHATSYVAHNVSADAPDLSQAEHIEHWYFLSGVSVLSTPDAAAIVTLGDSITDGHGSTTNANNRWPDDLSRRLQAAGIRNLSVLNEGIGGNRLRLDGLGPNALARFDRDVVAQPGVRYVLLLEGINDIGTATRDTVLTPEQHNALVLRVTSALDQLIQRAHTHGLPLYLATITPFVGSDYYHPDAATEADRQQVNAWIRTFSHADAVVDFDKVVADPANTERLLPAYDSGDHLHPSPTGYQAMANAIPLELFNTGKLRATKRPGAHRPK